MPEITRRNRSLQLLAIYLAVAEVLAFSRVIRGSGSPLALLGYAIVGAAVVYAMRNRGAAAGVLGDWLPLLALPILYAAIPATIAYGDGRMFDSVVQGWDRATFGTDPARTLAGMFPNVWLSEVLHGAYLSYYAIIYGPPLVLYLGRSDGAGGRDRAGFHETVLAFTVAMTACFVVFCLFPVEGPRYAWPAPVGVPEGPVRRVVLMLLEGGSSRGTAFPSSHMAIALAIGLSSLRWRRGLGLGVTVLSVLLGVGAVYGGFHYAVDMLAGAVAGICGWWAGSGIGPVRRDDSRARLNPLGTSG